MEPNLPPPPPDEKKPINWPVVVNLGLLVCGVILFRGSVTPLSVFIAALVVVNVSAALLTLLLGRKHWVAAFVLSALLLPLIGLGLCALLIKTSGLGHGH